MAQKRRMNRRDFLRMSAAGAGMFAFSASGLLVPTGLERRRIAQAEDRFYIEAFPTSPLILHPFTDPLPIPRALAPVPTSVWRTWKTPPDPRRGGVNDSFGGKHQLGPSDIGYPDPIVYQIKLKVNGHRFTSSKVLPIDHNGRPVIPPPGAGVTLDSNGAAHLPLSVVYGFNATFPGPMINVEYGRPVIVRFVNHLDENPLGLDRQDYGAPDYHFLTHLHNGHTAPESDGNPYYRVDGYGPGEWVDNLYLNYPAGGDDREKQSFCWFHDHRLDHTGANVYKGMVGLFPLYDPKNALDMGDERQGLRLPGVRRNRPDGAFDVEYDLPLAIYDCSLDDGVTIHKDFHDTGPAETHPEWWGKTFFKHFPNHGFVGDIFTVNGVAFPVLEVKRRKYRLRFLDASITRLYEFKLMSSTAGPKSAASLGYGGDELQGQYRLPDGQQSMKFVQIASEGGLIPHPIVRDSFELWPAKRREFIVDFTKYMDGSPTRKGDVIYLVNTMKMTNGRKWDSPDPNYKVPILKIVIGDDAPDDSLIPTALRAVPPLPSNLKELIDNRRVFDMERGSAGGEYEWLINGEPFDATVTARDKKGRLVRPKRGSYEAWEYRNRGGGWVHPTHIHQEEHRVVMRNGKPVPDARHPDDISKEDVIALDPGESVVIVRAFRTFTGKYVSHCHNLAHEDHAMMFGWEIVP